MMYHEHKGRCGTREKEEEEGWEEPREVPTRALHAAGLGRVLALLLFSICLPYRAVASASVRSVESLLR